MRRSSQIILGFFYWLLAWCLISPAHAQLSTIGREFFVGFMENHRVVPNRIDQATIIISAEEDADGFIQYVNNTINFSIKAGQQFVYDFPQDGLDIIHRTSRRVENKSVYIQSNGNISVHAFNFRERSADGTVVLPLSSIGKDYWVTAHYEQFAQGTNPGSNQNFESTLLILATEDDTRIEILLSALSVDPIPVPPGSTLTVDLKKGESYQIKAVGDLTGTRVRVIGSTDGDCKNIAVFGGNKMTSIGSDCNDATTGDHLFQQIYPTYSWGSEYIHIPLAGRTSGEMVKVLASENNTKVFVNGQERATLNAGRFTTFSFGKDELANITSNKPIAVTTFAKSYRCNEQLGPGAGDGDPTMITLSPNSQLIKKTVFSSVKVVGIVEHFVNIITLSSAAAQTILDGLNIGNQFLPVPGNTAYAYARVKLSESSHTLTNPVGIIAYAYGSGFIESYGYSAGASLNNLNFETEVAYDFEVIGDKVACLGEVGSWTVIPRDPKFEIFEWTFGTGAEVKEGRTVDHLFEKPGKYQIKIVALTGTRSCDQIEETFFEVEVLETKGEITGPDTVCPDIDEALYVFDNAINTKKVIWLIEGGEIIPKDDYSVKVKWGSFNPDAKVIAIPLTEEGCQGKPIEYKVIINEAINPGLAKGQSQICFEPGATYSYQVKDQVSNRQYKWFVEGGQILSQDNKETVEVQWGGIGSTGSIWYEEFSEINPSCAGISQKLQVFVNPPLTVSVAEITNFICPGSNNGKIKLAISGGTGNYIYQWSHDPNWNFDSADGLEAGIYGLVIKDSGGCTITLDSLEIKNSEPMQLLGMPNVRNAGCFDSKDGEIYFRIGGGFGNFRTDMENALVLGKDIQILGLERGDYLVTVYDESGCSLKIPFTIESPPALVVDFEIVNFACSGLPNGILDAIPSGGVLPYSISWAWDGSNNPRLIDVPSGFYPISVTDANGCQTQGLGQMKEGVPQLRMPTGFKPSDGFFLGVSNCEVEFKLFIYDKWGELIYQGNQGWDGTLKGQEAPLGSYSYMIEYIFRKDGQIQSKQQRGVFTLIR
ncbi:gliding motility-associated C-terminal domain-containing protein [Cecembia rubra]|uniref:Gliding motility-associated-like protein n=1 Tax=Cecembia rubra TaxID=1485585 RepID=A0A2P8ED05_9BACT|nr:gliding motility-associated C-terminal domain-containing protein [Cecembia rubra]PSL07324.1 gliding motility-associated-like protein [Cecembia rubra]